jgi:putative CocE/NonD family hydrolase
MNERGHFWSEGHYDILGAPRTDGTDAIEWLAARPWANGRVGLIGCSSTAEWQMAVAADRPKGLAAIVPQGFGAGVGRMRPYYEQGNWYRGGATQMLFIAWLYGEQNQLRPMFPPGTSQADLVRAARMFDLAPQMPPVDWAQALRHLPVQDILRNVGATPGSSPTRCPCPPGGRMAQRAPNDSAWYRGGLFHDDMTIATPGLWFISWYDVSAGPEPRHVQPRAPHRAQGGGRAAVRRHRPRAPLRVQARHRADRHRRAPHGRRAPRLRRVTWGWFDTFLKGERTGLLDTLPKVRYFTMGSNRWQAARTWPPEGAREVTYYLASGGRANTLRGDGRLVAAPPAADRPDRFSLRPDEPVPSLGGNVCCTGNAVAGGAFDQRKTEEREDVLVYSTEPLTEGVEASGPITVTLHVSSDAKDTDFTVKLLDVDAEGRAWNLDETIQRVRWREGYDRPETRMTPGQVYRVTLQPMTTSNWFAPGHRIRLEVSSSNFPRFDRNLNTGGRNYDEATGVVARNAVHHSRRYPSAVTLTVVPRATPAPGAR